MNKELYQIDWKKYLSDKRWRIEPEKDANIDSRNPFEVDFGKVVFCPALRRMHDKTQVIPLSSGDNMLTRLTHSMQVMNIAESLACNYTRSDNFLQLYDKPEEAFIDAQHIRAILKTASLLHDIGNPPFGHFGEASIKDYFKIFFGDKKDEEKTETLSEKKTETLSEKITKTLSEEQKTDFTEFDGNAQGLRIVSKLQYSGTLDGLNLTYGTLGSYMKYPNEGKKDKTGYIGNHKHGVFITEHELFQKIVENCNMKEGERIKRHPLAFLVEAADTICYGTMDVEDGLYQNWYSIKELLADLNRFVGDNRDIRDIIGFHISDDEMTNRDQRNVRLELREHLITYLVDLVIRNFNANIEGIDKGVYDNELVYDDPNHVAEALKDFTKRKILSNSNVLKFEITGNSVITGLFDILIKYFFHDDSSYRQRLKGIISNSRMIVSMKENKPEKYHEDHNITSDELDAFDVGDLSSYAKLRMIVDFVASMTDKYSVELYQTLSGNSL